MGTVTKIRCYYYEIGHSCLHIEPPPIPSYIIRKMEIGAGIYYNVKTNTGSAVGGKTEFAEY